MENKKPNKPIIIGNGFDLAHDLPTKYEDFILWVIKQISKKEE
jgi:Bacteriophage abortive infection AbiH